MGSGGRQKVIVSGAGVAGIEAALALNDLAGDRVEVELWDPRREFVYKPFAVGEPYGGSRSFRYDLERLAARCGASHRAGSIAAIDAARRVALTRDGQRIPYDCVVIASGVRMLWAVPGAITFWGVADDGPIGDVIGQLRAGALGKLVFTTPAGRGWALPLYELALLASTEVKRLGRDTRIAVVTPEERPLEAFGRRVAEGMEGLLRDRGIELAAGAHPIEFESGRLRVAPGEDLDADAAITLPRLEGRRIAGVPHDEDGFLAVDEHGRVLGLEGVFAAGDVTAFPVKQGGVAAQQADAAAEAIAVELGVRPAARPFDPILRAVLWTGDGPRYLYGRPTGGHGEVSGFSERPEGRLSTGKITARYFSPLVDELEAELDDPGQGSRATARRTRHG